MERRDFLRRTAILGASASTLLRRVTVAGEASSLFAQSDAPSDRVLDLAEWSYFWVGVEQARLARGTVVRSEEHTSELQSLRHLVCRLLLEKKKQLSRCPA